MTKLFFIKDIKKSGTSCSSFDGNKKYIATADIQNSEIVNYEIVNYENKPSRANLIVPEDSVLFAKMQGTNKVIRINNETKNNIYSTGFYAFKDERILPDYLKHYLSSRFFNDIKDKNCQGATMKAINDDGLSKISINVPELEEQQEIVQKLNVLTSLIDKNKQIIENYSQLVKSQFIEMFGDVYSLQNNATHSIGDYVSDKTLKASKLDNTTDIKYIDISSINNQSNEITSYTEYDINERPSRAQQVVNKGDILISTVRPNLNNVAMVTDSFNNMVASTGFCVIKKNEKVNEYFIFTLVKNIEFANYLTKLTTGANYPAVNNKAVLDFKIDLPPIELQNQFADFVKHIDKLKLNDMLMEVA